MRLEGYTAILERQVPCIILWRSLPQCWRAVCPETSCVLSWLPGSWPSPSPDASARDYGGCGSAPDYAEEKKRDRQREQKQYSIHVMS